MNERISLGAKVRQRARSRRELYGLHRQSEAATALFEGPATVRKTLAHPAIKSGVAASLCHRSPKMNPNRRFKTIGMPKVLARLKLLRSQARVSGRLFNLGVGRLLDTLNKNR